MSISDIEENMGFLDWEDRYRYLIDLGGSLEPLDEYARVDANLVSGCMSRVWLQLQPSDTHLAFKGDSESAIVRGLVAVLHAAYSGQTAEHILSYDLDGLFGRLGLNEHLSPNRRNGFYSMVGVLKAMAQKMSEEN